MFGRFGAWEILIIVLLVVILFGHAKIPGMMKNLADGIKVFKKELKDTKSDNVAAEQKVPVKKSVAKKTTAKKVASKPAATAVRKKTAKKTQK